GHRTVVYPSGLAACAGALLAFLSAGDQLLMSDTVYGPTRNFATGFLKRFGVSTTFFDPLAGSAIESLIRPETRAIYLESPGSLSSPRSNACSTRRSPEIRDTRSGSAILRAPAAFSAWCSRRASPSARSAR